MTPSQKQITKSTVDRELGTANRVWLFGSRVDDDLRGGDFAGTCGDLQPGVI